MPNQTEAELIEKAIAGSHQAFKSVMESYERLVYSIAYRFTRSKTEAEDLSQECFIRLWKNLSRYNPEYKLKAWLAKMITNICLDYLKSNRKKQEMNSVGFEMDFELNDSTNHEKELYASELQKIILALAAHLTPKQKAAFILRDMEMLSVEEVCEIMNETAENLKSNLYYARKNIRENLLKYYKTSLA